MTARNFVAIFRGSTTWQRARAYDEPDMVKIEISAWLVVMRGRNLGSLFILYSAVDVLFFNCAAVGHVSYINEGKA
jgi:hypothetical protein